MIRLPVPAGTLVAGELVLRGEEAHRVRDVLRLEVGAEVELFDGQGRVASARLEGFTPDPRLQVGAPREVPVAPPLCIAQGMPKGDKLEFVIQKATELGAAEVVPFDCMRAVVKLDGKKAAERQERWQRIAVEAARQCGRADVPQVGAVASLAHVLARPGAVGLLYEGETELRLGAFLDAAGERPVTLLIGPEGGFDPREVAQAQAAGARLVGLGSRILRTETVALAALAIALHRRGELG